jgi:branched-chain amino acid transport system permease protein/urea transport system permease protein
VTARARRPDWIGRVGGRTALTVAVWALLGLAPLAVSDWRLGQLAQLISYGIFAMSLAFVWGQAGLLCFGQAIFFGAGAYVMSVITKGMVPGVSDATAVGLAAATALPGLLAAIAGHAMFRGRGLSGAYFAIVTLAAAVIAERAASHWAFIGGFNGLLDVPPLRYGFGPARVDLLDPMVVYYVMLGAAGAVYLALLGLERSPLGTVLRAIRDNETRTPYFGFDVSAYKTMSFAVSGAVAGLAGGLFVTQFGFVSPALVGVALSTEVLIWTALGGREVLLAAFLGALVVRSVESALSERLGYYWLLALGALFVASVVLFPNGLLGRLLALPLPGRMVRRA